MDRDAEITRLKCDRAQPCHTCAYRGLSESCSYQRQSGDEYVRDSGPLNETRAEKNHSPKSVQASILELDPLLVSLRTSYIGSTNRPGIEIADQDAIWAAVMIRVCLAVVNLFVSIC
jgi:hypothetical protein